MLKGIRSLNQPGVWDGRLGTHPIFRQFWFGLLLSAQVFSQGLPAKPPQAWVGILFQDIPPEKMPKIYNHGSKAGAVQIQKVFEGASGHQAGLEPGDYILSVNGKPLDGRTTLIQAVQSKKSGDLITLKLGRDGKIFEQKMALSPRPEDLRAFTQSLQGRIAPSLSGKYYFKDIGPLKKNRGKVVLLDFWASWCGPCKMLAPTLEALYSRYQAQGLEIIGISSEPLTTLTAYQKSHPHSHPLFHDAQQATTALYHAYAYPTLVFIDKKGLIRAIEPGVQPMATMEARIKSLLNE